MGRWRKKNPQIADNFFSVGDMKNDKLWSCRKNHKVFEKNFIFSIGWSKNPIFNHKFLGCFYVKNGFFGKIALEAKKRRPNYGILDMLEIWSLFTYPYHYLADNGRFEQFSHQQNWKKFFGVQKWQKIDFPKNCSKVW